MDECPHCGKDKRSLDEIITSIKDFGKLDEKHLEEFDIVSLKNDIDAALELPRVKSDPIRTAKLQILKKILEECESEYEQYDSVDDEEKEFYEDNLIKIQKKLNIELSELINELSYY